MNILWIIIFIIISLIILYFTWNENKYSKNGKFKLLELPNLLSPEEADQIIQLAKQNGLSQSYVVSDNKLDSYDDKFRKSDQTWMSRSHHPVLEKLSKISYELTGLPQDNQEMIQVVRYEKGGKFDAHFDPCVKSEDICNQMNRGAGQRKTTLLIYLNDVMQGGETEFVNLRRKIKPEKGKGILFWSTDDDENVYKESLHRGSEVVEGEKWIATIWSHPLKYN